MPRIYYYIRYRKTSTTGSLFLYINTHVFIARQRGTWKMLFALVGRVRASNWIPSRDESSQSIYLINWVRKSMGSGKMMVEFFSAEMVLRVCTQRTLNEIIIRKCHRSNCRAENLNKKQTKKADTHLEVAQLQSGWWFGNDHRSLFERSGRLEFSLSSDDFGSCFTRRLRFSRHGPLQLDGQSDVLAVNCAPHIMYSLTLDGVKTLTFRHVPLWCPTIQWLRPTPPAIAITQSGQQTKIKSFKKNHRDFKVTISLWKNEAQNNEAMTKNKIKGNQFYVHSIRAQTACMDPEMVSRSPRISCKSLVPKMLRSVVWASRRVEWWAFSTLATDTVAFDTRK